MRKIFLSLGIFAACAVVAPSVFGGSDSYYSDKIPTFTLNQAILTALQRNPALLNAEQEIKRTRGVIIQVRAQVLPQVTARANFEWTDPNLQGARIFGNTTTTTPITPTGGAASPFESLPSQGGEIKP